MMIKWPLFIIPVVLAAAGQFRRLQEYMLAFLIALVATTIVSTLALQLLCRKSSESMGNHDSAIVGAGSVD
jgi:putative effector of murein hydrolase LrgA (UPF0299 family)